MIRHGIYLRTRIHRRPPKLSGSILHNGFPLHIFVRGVVLLVESHIDAFKDGGRGFLTY